MPQTEPRKILIVDDHPIVRRGLRQLIDAEHDFVTCGEAESAQQAVELVEQQRPDLVLVDLALQGANGLDLTRQLQARWPELPALVISLHDEELYAQRALDAGARGYVMKRATDDQIVQAIRRVLQGKIVVSDAVQKQVEAGRGMRMPGEARTTLDQLSDREFEVFQLLGRGFAPRHIAEQLTVSVKTVEVYRQRLKEKLGIDSAALLTRYAVEWYKEQGGQ